LAWLEFRRECHFSKDKSSTPEELVRSLELNQKRFGTSFASAISNHTLEASKQMHRNMAELVNGTFYRIYHGFTVPHIYLL